MTKITDNTNNKWFDTFENVVQTNQVLQDETFLNHSKNTVTFIMQKN